jgi:hypothetical protein
MEIEMFKPRPLLRLLLVLMSTMLAACAGMDSGGLTQVPITDFKMVAGKWGGLVTDITPRQDNWVDVTIMPDGKYDFGIYRTIGVFGGKGSFTLTDGKLEARGPRGSATYTLYQSGTRRVLRVQAKLFDGRQVSARLSPKE